MSAKLKLDEMKWTGNSRKMYDEILELLPAMYRAIVRKQFEVWANKNNKDTITEITIKHTIEKFGKKAPGDLESKLMPIYEKHKTEIE